MRGWLDKTFRRFLRDAAITSSATFINAGLGLLRAAVLARYLGLEGMGRFGIVISAGAFLLQLMSVRVWEWVTRGLSDAHSSRDRDLAGAYTRAGFQLSFAIHGAAAMVLVLAAEPIATHALKMSELADPLRASALLVFAPWPNETSQAALRIVGRFKLLAVYNVGSSLAQFVLILACWAVDASLTTMLLAVGFAQWGASAILKRAAVPCSQLHFRGRLGQSTAVLRKQWRTHAKTLFTLSLTATVKTLSEQLDVLLLARFHSAEVTGLYTEARKLVLSLLRLSTPAYMVLVPELTKAAARRDANTVNSLSKRVGWLGFALGLLAAGGVALLSEPIVVALFGSEFRDSGPLLAMMAPSLMILSVAWANPLFLAVDRPSWTLWMVLSGTAVRLGVIAIAVPTLAAAGAALAFTASHGAIVVTALALSIFARRRLRALPTSETTSCAAS